MAVTPAPTALAAAPAQTSTPMPGPLHHLKLLFWLKWTMTFRAIARSRSAVLGIILIVLFFAPLSLGMGVGLGWAFVSLPPFTAEQTLRATLLAIYFVWLLSPLAGFAVNDTYDITRLFIYPVSVRRIFSGAIFGSLLDLTTLLLLPTLFAALWGFGHTSVFAFLIALLALPLFLFQTLALSQAVLLASTGILRSRKFRDVALVVVPSFWLAYQLGNHFLWPSLIKSAKVTDWKNVLHSPSWELANLLPPGLTARAVASASQNHVLPALGFLFVLAAVTVATVYFSAWLVQKAYNGDDVSPKAHGSNRAAILAAPPATADETGAALPEAARDITLAGFKLPAVVAAVFDKEIKYYLREPYYRVVLMNFVYALVMAFVVTFNKTKSGGSSSGPNLSALFPGSTVWFATGLLLLRQSFLFNNLFGTDGAAASLLLSFPAPRRQILIGKNLPLLVAGAIINTVLVTLLCVLTKSLALIVVFIPWVLLALVVMASIGNMFSIFYPSPVVMKGFRARGQTLSAASSQGLGATFIYLGVSLGAMFLYVPVLAALLVPLLFVGKMWLVLTVPLAALYAGGLYLLSLKLAEPALLEREISIMEKVYRAADAS